MTIEDMLAEPGIAWLCIAAVLAIVELIMPGIFLVFIAAGAALTAAVVLLVPGIGLIPEILLFAAFSAAAVAVGRRWYYRNPVPSADPLLNDRTARLIGEVVTVADAIVAGQGRVRVGDGEWIARGPDAAAGTLVRIIGAQGTALDVEPVTT